MRTIQLTHEQIELISQALGIAETQFTNIHTNIIESTVNVRKCVSKREQRSKADYYHELACKMADLNIELNNGELDV